MDFQIPRASITGVNGPSGAGKSTLLRMIVGTQATIRGRLPVLGLSAGSPAPRRRVGYATQQASVYADLTVAENLAYCAGLLKKPRSRLEEVIESLGLQNKFTTIVHNLSGEQRSRVSLGMALIGGPEVPILFETDGRT